MTFREIRLWHWRQLKAVRVMQDTPQSKDPDITRMLRELASRHLGVVQCLNDYVDGTAEQDELSTDTSISVLDARSRAICGAGDLAELCSRYAAHLEKSDVKDLSRILLAREMAVILFRAAELERNNA